MDNESRSLDSSDEEYMDLNESMSLNTESSPFVCDDYEPDPDFTTQDCSSSDESDEILDESIAKLLKDLRTTIDKLTTQFSVLKFNKKYE